MRTRTVEEVLDMVKHGLRAGKFAPRQDSFAVAKKRQARPCAPAAFALQDLRLELRCPSLRVKGALQ